MNHSRLRKKQQTSAMQTDAENTMQTDAAQTDVVQTDIVQTDAVQTGVVHTDVTQTGVVQTDAVQTDTVQTEAKKPKKPDPVVALNNLLQRSSEGNVTRDFTWVMAQTGPSNQAIHHATAKLRGFELGVGEGVSKGRAKMAAAEQALDYLKENSLPQQQQQQQDQD
ncbi:hypothetical protein V8E53_013634 [Lactarius tabidus]